SPGGMSRGISTGILSTVSAPSKGTTMPVVGMRVKKMGTTTNLTAGIIYFIRYDGRFFTIFPDRSVMRPTQPFVAPGDSGSAIVEDATGHVVGLLNTGIGTYGDPDIAGGAAMIDAVTRALRCFVYDARQGIWVKSPAQIGSSGCAFVITDPDAAATLSVRYPS